MVYRLLFQHDDSSAVSQDSDRIGIDLMNQVHDERLTLPGGDGWGRVVYRSPRGPLEVKIVANGEQHSHVCHAYYLTPRAI